MRPLRYAINITLDGCCDHMAGMPSAELHRHHAENIAQAGALLLGRVTYQMMEDAWRGPAQTGQRPDWMDEWMLPFARTIDAAKKYVVSSTLKKVDWNAELLPGDLATAVTALKQQPGGYILLGGVTLPQALANLGLIDEYELVIHPKFAGRGPTLFAGLEKPLELELMEEKRLGSGAVVLRYGVRGKPAVART